MFSTIFLPNTGISPEVSENNIFNVQTTSEPKIIFKGIVLKLKHDDVEVYGLYKRTRKKIRKWF